VSTQLVSSLSFPLSDAASPPINITTLSRRVTLPFYRAKTSLLPRVRLPVTLHPVISSPRAETKTLNLHHHHRPPYLDRSTPTLHCYRKIISILITLPTTQPCLYFVSFLGQYIIRAPLTVVVFFHYCPTLIILIHNDTSSDELINPLLFLK
jgi:hypothetical protein